MENRKGMRGWRKTPRRFGIMKWDYYTSAAEKSIRGSGVQPSGERDRNENALSAIPLPRAFLRPALTWAKREGFSAPPTFVRTGRFTRNRTPPGRSGSRFTGAKEPFTSTTSISPAPPFVKRRRKSVQQVRSGGQNPKKNPMIPVPKKGVPFSVRAVLL
jgi:hypothetical protein